MSKIDKTEAGVSAIKSLLGAVPFAGTLLSEALFDYRSRIKEKRFKLFVSELSKTLEKLDSTKVDFAYLKTDEFSDILEETIRRAISTSSNEKINRFKMILIGEMTGSLKSEYKLSFLDITSQLSEIQLIILKQYNTIGKSVGKYYRDIESLNDQIPEIEKGLQNEKLLAKRGYANNTTLFESRLKLLRKELRKKQQATKQSESKRFGKHYNLTQEESLIHVQDLLSKGLMVDLGIGLSNYYGFPIFEITGYGKEYLKFILEGKTNPE